MKSAEICSENASWITPARWKSLIFKKCDNLSYHNLYRHALVLILFLISLHIKTFKQQMHSTKPNHYSYSNQYQKGTTCACKTSIVPPEDGVVPEDDVVEDEYWPCDVTVLCEAPSACCCEGCLLCATYVCESTNTTC